MEESYGADPSAFQLATVSSGALLPAGDDSKWPRAEVPTPTP